MDSEAIKLDNCSVPHNVFLNPNEAVIRCDLTKGAVEFQRELFRHGIFSKLRIDTNHVNFYITREEFNAIYNK